LSGARVGLSRPLVGARRHDLLKKSEIADAVDLAQRAGSDAGARFAGLARLLAPLPEVQKQGSAEAKGTLSTISIQVADAFSLDLDGDGENARLLPILNRAGGGEPKAPLLTGPLQRALACNQFDALGSSVRNIDGEPPPAYLNSTMAKLPIITAPDPRLKIRARQVSAVDEKVRRLMDDMLETMYGAIGIGLAAPQVGRSERVIVVDVARDGEKPQPMKLANPEIIWQSPELTIGNEGCLSLPEHYAEVTRPEKIRLRYLDYQNEIREMEATGLLATCLQHEIDHLDGVLFVDHLSSLKRGMILRKLAKAKRSQVLENA
jgi:peptide deformylase